MLFRRSFYFQAIHGRVRAQTSRAPHQAISRHSETCIHSKLELSRSRDCCFSSRDPELELERTCFVNYTNIKEAPSARWTLNLSRGRQLQY